MEGAAELTTPTFDRTRGRGGRDGKIDLKGESAGGWHDSLTVDSQCLNILRPRSEGGGAGAGAWCISIAAPSTVLQYKVVLR